MNLEVIPLSTFGRWVTFGVALVVAAVVLWPNTAGLVPALAAYAVFVIFRPPRDQFTDAELEAWLHG